jgi:hypothetical protein
MQPTSHRIRVDAGLKLVEVKLAGLVTPEDAQWIGEEVRAAVRSLGADVGQHVTLYDASEVPVVPGATITQLQQTWVNPEVRNLWARKVAYVVGSVLGRLQINRLREARDDIAIFDNRADALEWLLAP